MAGSKVQHPAPERLDDIASLAEYIAETRFPTGSVEPISIAKSLGITLSHGRYGGAFDGMIEHRSGRFHIYCNLDRLQHENSSRARFTVAHELGHYFIDDHRLALMAGRVPAHPSKCDHESKNPVEREADHFASNLLLPAARFKRQARRAGRGLAGVLSLSRHFGTSVTSTAIRFASLEVEPCIVVKWTPKGFGWSWSSASAWASRYGATIQEPAAIPRGAPTARAMTGEPPPTQGFFEAGTTAAAWFKRIAGDADRNAIMIEQAMQLGQFGTLTILLPECSSR